MEVSIFSGMWAIRQTPDVPRQDPPYQPWAAEMNAELLALNFQNPRRLLPTSECRNV